MAKRTTKRRLQIVSVLFAALSVFPILRTPKDGLRRWVLPLVGTLAWFYFAGRLLLISGLAGDEFSGFIWHLLGPLGLVVVAVSVLTSLQVLRRRQGFLGNFSGFVRLCFGPFILILLTGKLLLVVCAVLVYFAARAGGWIYGRAQSFLYPIAAVPLLVIIHWLSASYPSSVILYFTVLAAVGLSALMAFWLYLWSYRPVLFVDKILEKFSGHIQDRLQPESEKSDASRGKAKGDSEKPDSKLALRDDENQMRTLLEALAGIKKVLPKAMRHQWAMHIFLFVFFGVVAYSVWAFGVALNCLVQVGGGHIATPEGYQFVDFLHVSLQALVFADAQDVEFAGTLGRALLSLETLHGIWYFVVLILSFSTASSTYTEAALRSGGESVALAETLIAQRLQELREASSISDADIVETDPDASEGAGES